MKSILAVVGFSLVAFIGGFGVGAGFGTEDTEAVWCDAASTGWVAAHVNLYAYLQVTDPELFASNFRPVKPELKQNLIDQCLEDYETTHGALTAIVERLNPISSSGTGK